MHLGLHRIPFRIDSFFTVSTVFISFIHSNCSLIVSVSSLGDRTRACAVRTCSSKTAFGGGAMADWTCTEEVRLSASVVTFSVNLGESRFSGG